MDNNKILPIGSIVLLKNSTKRLMIMGFCQSRPEDLEKIYDYCGCVYPEGYMSFDQVFLFDHAQIEEVMSEGFRDEEQASFEERLKEIRQELKGIG